ncbi:hypothetical protein TNCV_1837701 [Trichonephila clavipes]|nr:hypothetical protein TNCV_1837701 [Trichonephila clavipes]
MALSVLSNNTSLVYDANLVLNFVPEMTDFLIAASFFLIALTVDSPKLKEKIELREDLKSRRGLAVSLEIICHNCEESTSTMSSKISNKCYDVNLRLTYGMRAIGKVELLLEYSVGS